MRMTAEKFVANCNELLKITSKLKKDVLLGNYELINEEVILQKKSLYNETLDKEDQIGADMEKHEEAVEILEMIRKHDTLNK